MTTKTKEQKIKECMNTKCTWHRKQRDIALCEGRAAYIAKEAKAKKKWCPLLEKGGNQ